MTKEDKAMVPGEELLIRPYAPNATKNAKSRSSPVATVRYIARNAFQTAEKAICLTQTGIAGLKKEIFTRDTGSIKGKNPLKRRCLFLDVEKRAFKYLDKARTLLSHFVT